MNPLRQIARHTPAPLNALADMAGAVLADAASVVDGFPGNDPDDWDAEYIERTLPVMSKTFGAYFRGEVRGLENIPDGPSLLVGNHSGGIMIADTFVFSIRFYEHFGAQRRFHQLAHMLAARNPALGQLRRYGTLLASHENARQAFARDAPVLVYPGGDYETFRPSWHGDKIEFGGRQGFIRLALDAGVPIVPVVAVGGQETALFVTRGERAASLLGLNRLARVKVLPVSVGPPFGLNFLDLPGRFPLPAKITVQVRPAIDLAERFGADPDPDEVYQDITAEMQDTLSDLSDERTLPVVG